MALLLKSCGFSVINRVSHDNFLYVVKIPFSYEIILANGENKQKGWSSGPLKHDYFMTGV